MEDPVLSRARAGLLQPWGRQRQEKGRSGDRKPRGRTGEQGQGRSPRRRAGRAQAVTPAAGWGPHQPEPATSMLGSTLALPAAAAEGSSLGWLSRPPPWAKQAGGLQLLCLLPCGCQLAMPGVGPESCRWHRGDGGVQWTFYLEGCQERRSCLRIGMKQFPFHQELEEKLNTKNKPSR